MVLVILNLFLLYSGCWLDHLGVGRPHDSDMIVWVLGRPCFRLDPLVRVRSWFRLDPVVLVNAWFWLDTISSD